MVAGDEDTGASPLKTTPPLKHESTLSHKPSVPTPLTLRPLLVTSPMTYAEITRKKRAKPPAIDGLQDKNKSDPYLAASGSGDLNGFVKQKPSRRKKNRNSSNTA